MTYDRFGSSSHLQRTVCYHIPRPRSVFACCAQRKINSYRQQYADNQNISFLPVIVSTSTRMHCESLRLLFLQAHRETEAHFAAAGMSSQRNQSDLVYHLTVYRHQGRWSETCACILMHWMCTRTGTSSSRIVPSKYVNPVEKKGSRPKPRLSDPHVRCPECPGRASSSVVLGTARTNARSRSHPSYQLWRSQGRRPRRDRMCGRQTRARRSSTCRRSCSCSPRTTRQP